MPNRQRVIAAAVVAVYGSVFLRSLVTMSAAPLTPPVAPAFENSATAQTDCSAIETQLDRDKTALQRQQHAIEMGSKELEEWTQANDEAQKEALLTGIKALTGAAADQLMEMEKEARTFDQFLKDRKVPLYIAQNASARAKVEEAFQAYQKASTAARTATFGQASLQALDVWELFQNLIGTIARVQLGGDAALRQAMDDPGIQRYLQADAQGQDVYRDLEHSLLTMGVHSTTIAKLIGDPAVKAFDLADFLVDYGYDATKWMQSRARILQQSNLSDQQLQAVDGLKKQIERTVKRLQDCRAGAATAAGAADGQPPPPQPKAKSRHASAPLVIAVIAGVATAGAVGAVLAGNALSQQLSSASSSTTCNANFSSPSLVCNAVYESFNGTSECTVAQSAAQAYCKCEGYSTYNPSATGFGLNPPSVTCR